MQSHIRRVREIGEGAVGRKARENRSPDCQAAGSAQYRRQQRLDEELSRDLQSSGPESDARRQFAAACVGARQRQVGNVEGADQQDDAGSSPEQIERAPNRSRERFLEGRHRAVHPKLGIAELRKSFDVRRVKRVELRLDLLDGRAGPQPADVKEAVARPRGVRFLLWRKRQRNPELNALHPIGMTAVFLIEETELARHHADNRVQTAIPREAKRPPDDVRVAAENALPKRVAQDDLLIVSGLAFGVGERPPEQRRYLQDAEERRRSADPRTSCGTPSTVSVSNQNVKRPCCSSVVSASSRSKYEGVSFERMSFGVIVG